jgi:hypothetical protein
MTARAITLAAALAALAGCVPQGQLYHWNGYDDALYRHYKNPQDREAWIGRLRTTIGEAENRGLKVPPGIYAEYGYALLEEGRTQDAVRYFRREQEKWPESRVFMEKMIRNAERRAGQAPPAAKGPAGALEDAR